MYYEINVAKNGKHYFATAERSITDSHKAAEVAGHFLTLFPAHEGYKISVSYYSGMSMGASIETSENLLDKIKSLHH